MTNAADDFDALFDEVSAQRDDAAVQSMAGQTTAPLVAETEQESAVIPTVETRSETEQESQDHESALDKPMFDRLGGIVRMLHDSLHELGYDKAITNAATQINDAQDRLEYVATLTEQAATKVLNTLDQGMPEQDELSKKAKNMESRWDALFAGNLSIDEFKILAGDSKSFANAVTSATEAEKARLLDIMMAQDFQDITGQLIKKVVGITKAVEHELAQLLRDNAPPAVKEKLASVQDLMHGPSVPGEAMAQDSVDDLLADLGF